MAGCVAATAQQRLSNRSLSGRSSPKTRLSFTYFSMFLERMKKKRAITFFSKNASNLTKSIENFDKGRPQDTGVAHTSPYKSELWGAELRERGPHRFPATRIKQGWAGTNHLPYPISARGIFSRAS